MRRLVAIVLINLSILAGFSASADTSDDVKAAVFEAEAMYEFGDYTGASDAYRKAYQLSRNFELLFEIANCESAAKRWGAALDAYQQYLSKGGENVPPARRQLVAAEIKMLESKVGYLEIDAPDGTVVVVDNVERGTTPLPEKLPVESDEEHEVVIGDSAAQIVVVSWGETQTVEPRRFGADFEEYETGDSYEESHEDNVKKPKSKLRTAGLITVISGGGVLLVGLATGAATLAYDKKLEDSCFSGQCSESQSGTLDARDDLAITTNVLLGVGAAALTTGIVMMAIKPAEKKSSSSLEGDMPSRSTSKKGSKSWMVVTGWTASTLGAAALIASGITGGIALSHNKKLNELCTDGVCEFDKEGLLHERDNLVTATNVMMIAGGSLLVGGIVLLVLAPKEQKSFAFNGMVLPDGAFAAIEWRF